MPEMLHDYSPGGTGVVPPGERRSRWHRVGDPLAKAVAAAALGAVCYLGEAAP
jgi:hypothetical protein